MTRTRRRPARIGSPRMKPRAHGSAVDGKGIPAMIGLTLAWRVPGAFDYLATETDSESGSISP